MNGQRERFYEFGPFRVDAVKRRLLRAGDLVPLTPKAFDVLLVLLRHNGEVMEKEELMKSLWPDSFVEEANLSVNISALRKALGESPQDHRYIVTVPGRGYSFVADVARLCDDETELILRERTRSSVIIEEEEVAPPDRAERILPDTQAALTVDSDRSIAPAHVLPLKDKSEVSRWVRALVAIVVAVVAAASLGLYMLSGRSGRGASFSRVKLERLTTTGDALHAAISPDGKYIAYVMGDQRQQSLWVRQVAVSNGVQIIPPSTSTGGYVDLSFSPDGNYIYYIMFERVGLVSGLYKIPVLGGPAKKLVNEIDTNVTFSPDGKRLAFARNHTPDGESQLRIANADGTEERTLAALKLTDSFTVPSWSPDGKVIAAAVRHRGAGGDAAKVVEVSVADGTVRQINPQRWTNIKGLVWLADGSGLLMTAYAQPEIAAQVWHLDYPNGEARRVTNDFSDYSRLSITRDSAAFVSVVSDPLSSVWVAPDGDAKRAAQISSQVGRYGGLAWMPDGKIVYSTNATGKQELWIMERDGSGRKQLTVDSGSNSQPLVTPDGRYIVFVSDRAGAQNIWRMNTDGSDPKQLTGGSGSESNPASSPDGRWIVYASGTSRTKLYKVSIDGGPPVKLTPADTVWSRSPAVNPRDGMIACLYLDEAGGEDSEWKIALIPPQGGSPVKTFDPPKGIYFPAGLRWTVDGRAVTLVAMQNGIANIWSQPVDGGQPRLVTDFKSDWIFWFDWSRDALWLASARGVLSQNVVMVSDLR